MTCVPFPAYSVGKAGGIRRPPDHILLLCFSPLFDVYTEFGTLPANGNLPTYMRFSISFHACVVKQLLSKSSDRLAHKEYGIVNERLFASASRR